MKLKSKKSALLLSFTSLLLCFAMLAGSTFAWFTDTATTGVNKIVSGTLDVGLEMAIEWDSEGKPTKWANAEGKTLEWQKKATADAEAEAQILWEPGCTYKLPELRVVNNGNLALKYKLQITGIQGDAKLNKVIEWKINGAAINLTEKSLAAATANGPTYSDEITISGHMKEKAGNEYQNLTIDGIAITVYATQDTVENDSFNNTYDENATYYPVLDAAGLKDALVNGGNIKVDDDVAVAPVVEDVTVSTLVPQMTLTKDTTLDLSGNKISVQHDETTNFGSASPVLMAVTDGTLTIEGNGEINCEADDQQVYGINVNGGNVVVNDGKFYGAITAIQVQKGSLVINGGFFDMAPTCKAQVPHYAKYVINCIDANYKNGTAKIIVKGGTFVNFDPSANPEGEGTTYVADGYSVISEQHGADTWYTVVKGQGATASTQEALNDAIQNNPSPTVKLAEAGTYTLPEMSGKDVTIVGTKDTVIDMKGEDGKGKVNKAAAASFEGVTVAFGAEDYKGFQHTGKLTYKDCTITGKQFLYATDVEFINCKFVQDAVDYNVWTYGAGKVLFKDCEFECEGKAVLIYNEGSINGQTVEFQNCKFTASAPVAGKAAIEIDSSLLPDGGTYKVIIDQSTADNVTGFAAGSVSGNTVWNNKKGTKATVIVAGNTMLSAS
ncbi:MAG: SipW-dependent-type signal peptide-containing protein [Clostridia bacterium]|nr:SipW-dependent-type signal peptide-containing protein [Clostridia bacterium]